MSERNRDLEILQHSMGLDQYGQGSEYRNRFVAGPGCRDYDACCSLVERGLMVNRGSLGALSGGDDVFTVTDAGRQYIRENSPKPPKLTRSQRRYQRFLDADSPLHIPAAGE